MPSRRRQLCLLSSPAVHGVPQSRRMPRTLSLWWPGLAASTFVYLKRWDAPLPCCFLAGDQPAGLGWRMLRCERRNTLFLHLSLACSCAEPCCLRLESDSSDCGPDFHCRKISGIIMAGDRGEFRRELLWRCTAVLRGGHRFVILAAGGAGDADVLAMGAIRTLLAEHDVARLSRSSGQERCMAQLLVMLAGALTGGLVWGALCAKSRSAEDARMP